MHTTTCTTLFEWAIFIPAFFYPLGTNNHEISNIQVEGLCKNDEQKTVNFYLVQETMNAHFATMDAHLVANYTYSCDITWAHIPCFIKA